MRYVITREYGYERSIHGPFDKSGVNFFLRHPPTERGTLRVFELTEVTLVDKPTVTTTYHKELP